MGNSSSCFDCKVGTPETNSDYTLIRLGWRVVREQHPNATIAFIWRCPSCWTLFKARSGHGSTASFQRVVLPASSSTKGTDESPADNPRPSQRSPRAD